MYWVNKNDFEIENNTKAIFGNTYTTFCHYTTLDAAISILDNGIFYMSPFENMNDCAEYELHKAEGDKIFSLCFCNSKSENIPLWYLYSGIDGNGTRIEFTGAKIRDLINQGKKVVYDLSNGNECELMTTEYEIHYGWIYYEENNSKVSYRGHPLSKTDLKKFNQCKNTEDSIFYFRKGFPWRYEKEFRILVIVKKRGVNKIAIKFDFEKLKEGIKIYSAPEATKDHLLKIQKFAKQKGWKKIKLRGKSNLKICMRLMNKNFEQYINKICKEQILY